MVFRCILAGVIGYLLGNISSGFLVSKAYGLRDIRKHGSGNSGTTNVLTLVGDCLKGYAACLIGRALGGDLGMLIGGACAILGHDFPALMGFRGGKGVATSLGLIIAIDPRMAVALLVVQIAAVALTRYMSIASLITTVAFPILTVIMEHGRAHYLMFILFACGAAALSLFGHRGNIRRLIQGDENRLDFDRISRISEKVMQRMHKRKKP